jgi:flagellar protein FliS
MASAAARFEELGFMAMANTYLETEVATASPLRLHLMVVEAAIRYARRAGAALEAGDAHGAAQAFARSRESVGELIAAIRPDPNAELSERLRALFVYVVRQLAQAELRSDAALLQSALHVLELHRETWLALISQLKSAHAVDATTMPSDSSRSWLS